MGRRATVHLNLPKGMRARRKAGGVLWYYLDLGRQADGTRPEEPLGNDYIAALRKYADLVKTTHKPATAVPEILTGWRDATIAGRKRGTQKDIEWCLTKLLAFFGDPPAPVAEIRPVHVRQYLDWRSAAPYRANREIAWFSAAWNWARDRGLIDVPNPCAGVKRHKEPGRKTYIEDDEYAAIEAHAGEPLREAMELAYLTGQRPGDLREMRETDIRDGCLHIEQAKTDARLAVEITGQLAALLDRIRARKASLPGVRTLSLLADENGAPMTKAKLRRRFELAREAAAKAAGNPAMAERIRAIQFRDLRAKTGTDVRAAAGLDAAQALLGHTKSAMTEHYTRQRRGAKVKPLK